VVRVPARAAGGHPDAALLLTPPTAVVIDQAKQLGLDHHVGTLRARARDDGGSVAAALPPPTGTGIEVTPRSPRGDHWVVGDVARGLEVASSDRMIDRGGSCRSSARVLPSPSPVTNTSERRQRAWRPPLRLVRIELRDVEALERAREARAGKRPERRGVARGARARRFACTTLAAVVAPRAAFGEPASKRGRRPVPGRPFATRLALEPRPSARRSLALRAARERSNGRRGGRSAGRSAITPMGDRGRAHVSHDPMSPARQTRALECPLPVGVR